jgi:ATP/maltotriose-dependent transcriptional regulator MalT
MLYLAITLWPLGDIRRAMSLVGDAEARIAGLAHIGTRAVGRMHAALFALTRGDMSGAAPNSAELAQLAREHDLPMWRAWGVFLEGVAKAQDGALSGGLEAMRCGAVLLREKDILMFDGLVKVALAEAEARAGNIDRAVAVLDEALVTSERIGHRTFDAELHRVRGEMLLKRDPANPAIAEEALQTATAVAKKQGTRSFELSAALSLAKLYQSTGRPVEAHAVLAPPLEGFSPTPEMPEIAEAQALLAALADSEEIKAAEAQRERRLRLQTDCGQAVLWSKGFAAEETKAAFARARALAGSSENAATIFSIYFEQWVRGFVCGDLISARNVAETFSAKPRTAAMQRKPASPAAFLAQPVSFKAISPKRESTLSAQSPTMRPIETARRASGSASIRAPAPWLTSR